MRAVNRCLGRKTTITIGLVFVLTSAALFWFIFQIEVLIRIEIVLTVACVLLGIGTSTTNISSFSLTSDLIGLNTECGAFVYGTMSFADKLANGVTIAVIQQVNPCNADETNGCKLFYRQVLSFIPAGVAILTILITLSLWKSNIGGNQLEMSNQKHSNSLPSNSHVNEAEYNEQSPLLD